MKRKSDRHIGRTPGLIALERAGIAFSPRAYEYREKGGAPHAAEALGEDLHRVVKTLVMEDEAGRPLLVLMHGDRQVSMKKLARAAGCKRVRPCSATSAERHTGYKVGGISPFGAGKSMPVVMQQSILDLDRVLINAGRRGLLVEVAVPDVVAVLRPTAADVASESPAKREGAGQG